MRHAIILLVLVVPFLGLTQTAEELVEKAGEYAAQEDYKKAVSYMDEALLLKDSAIFYIDKAFFLWMDGEAIMALECYNEGLSKHPNYSPLYNARGVLYQKALQLQLAERDYSMAVKFAEGDSAKYSCKVNLCVAYYLQRKFDEAYNGLMECYQYDSLDVETLNNLAMVCDEVGKGDSTLYYLHKVIEIDSTQSSAVMNVGFKYQIMGEYEKSILYFDKAIVLDPYGAFAYNNRAYSKLKMGKFSEALQDVNKSLELNEINSYAYRNRALIYIEMGKMKKACKDLEKALEFNFTQMYGNEVLDLQRRYCN